MQSKYLYLYMPESIGWGWAGVRNSWISAPNLSLLWYWSNYFTVSRFNFLISNTLHVECVLPLGTDLNINSAGRLALIINYNWLNIRKERKGVGWIDKELGGYMGNTRRKGGRDKGRKRWKKERKWIREGEEIIY